VCSDSARSPLLGATLVFLCSLVAAGPRDAHAGAGKQFKTPEAAVQHFLSSLAANDLDAAMQACAVEEFAARVNVAAQLRRTRSLMTSREYGPGQYSMYARINRARAMADFAHGVQMYSFGLLSDKRAEGNLVVDMSDRDIDAFIRAVNPARLAALKIVRIDKPVRSIFDSAKVTSLFKKQAVPEGADELTERIALVWLDGQHYWGGFRLVRYGASWRIRDLVSILASSPRPVGKTTVAEYEGVVAGPDPKAAGALSK
jgi:hypothetical protein